MTFVAPKRSATSLAILAIAVLSSCAADVADTSGVNDAYRTRLEASHAAQFDIDDATGECMRELGFDYESQLAPMRVFAQAGISATSLIPVFLDNFEDWTTHGYGYLDLVLPTLFLSQATDTVSDEDGFTAYDFALWGDPLDAADLGCSGQARQANPAANGIEQMIADRHRTDNELAVELEGTQLYLEWSTCMRSEGFELQSLSGPSQLVIDAINEDLLKPASGPGPTNAEFALEFDAVSGRFVDDNYQTVLDDLRELEHDIAAADFRCSQELYPFAQSLLNSE
jgi:hypothetical protein